MERTAVLIPSYNEAKTIGGIVERLKKGGANVYVVDDGSADETAREAASRGAIVITHAVNKGKGASLREGFAAIMKDGYDHILVIDGDGQHHLEDIGNFASAIDEPGVGIVIGSRMSDTRRMPLERIIVNKMMSLVISKMAGQRIPDTQCGFRLIKRQVLEGIRLDSSNYEMESELLIKAAHNGWKIRSVPIRTIYQDEASRIHPVKDTLRFLALIFRLMFSGR